MPGPNRDFSIAEAIGSGFRLPRERPRAMLAWIVLQLPFTAAQTVLTAPFPDQYQKLQAMMAQPAPDEAAVSGLLAAMIPRVAMAAGLSLVSWSILAAAASRSVLRPQESRFGYLRLGGDELRVFASLLIILAILTVSYMAAMLAITTVLAAGGGMAGAVLLSPLVALALIWLWSRLSLAPAMTLAGGRIEAVGSWALTRGRATRVFLTMLAATALSFVVLLLGAIIVSGLLGVAGLAPPTGDDARAWMSAAGLVAIAASAVLAALGAAIVLCPPAVIFRRLAADQRRQ